MWLTVFDTTSVMGLVLMHLNIPKVVIPAMYAAIVIIIIHFRSRLSHVLWMSLILPLHRLKGHSYLSYVHER